MFVLPQIPIRLTLAANEVVDVAAPPPVYVMAPRLGYLPTVAQGAKQHFQHVLPHGEDTPWFEYNGLPLRWQTPVGVLYDMLAQSQERPWRLTIHYRSFPADVLLRWDGTDTLRASFFNSLKEASCICRGSAGRVMGMASSLQQELWEAVEAADGARFTELSDALDLAPVARQERRPAVPLRLTLVPSTGGFVGYEDVESTSRPIEASREDGSLVSLADALLQTWPALQLPTFPPTGLSAPSEAPERSSAGDGGDAAEKNVSAAEAGAANRNPRAVCVLINGVRTSLQLPIAWLHARMHAADHFLYVTVYALL